MREAILVVALCAPTLADADDSWWNAALYKAARDGLISEGQLDRDFEIAMSSCRLESLKIPVPPPVCTAAQPISCDGLTGFVYGTCVANAQNAQRQDCNYTGTNEARTTQELVLKSCMTLRGWKRGPMPAELLEPASPSALSDPATFYAALLERVPGWERIDADPRWHSYLANYDPASGVQRQKLLEAAADRSDVDDVVEMFMDYLKTTAD